MANKYVRLTAQGSANGNDWNNAWSLPNLVSNQGSLSAGDTVWIAGGNGTEYTTTIVWTKSGTAGNPITLKRPTVNDAIPVAAAGWSSAFDTQVVIHSSNDNAFEISSSSTVSYVTIDGNVSLGIKLLVDNVNSAFLGCIAVNNTGAHHHISAYNCDLSGPGGSTPYPYLGDYACLNIRTSSPSSHDFLISHCTLRGCPNLIRSVFTGNIVVEYCIFKDNVTQSGFSHENMWYDESSTGNILRYCDLSGWGVEGINLQFGVPNANTWTVIGNVFHDPAQGVATCFWPFSSGGTTPQGPLILEQNTFVNVDITSVQGNGSQFSSNSIARNNIYYNATFNPISVITDSDYNCSNSTAVGSHSISTMTSAAFVNYAGGNYRIIGTVASNFPRGKGLTGLGITTDILGNAYANPPSMGAYEYFTGGGTTTAYKRVGRYLRLFGPALVLAFCVATFGRLKTIL